MQFVNNNPTLSLAFIGVVGTLLGATVTQILNIFVKKIELESQCRYRKIDWSWEFEKKHVIESL